jgi:hypothetical protein
MEAGTKGSWPKALFPLVGIKSEELRMLFIEKSGAAIFPELEVGEATKERPQKCRPILVALLFYS